MKNGNLPQPSESGLSDSSPAKSGADPSAPDAGGASSASGDPGLDLAQIVEVLVREKWVILLICGLVVGGVAGYTYMQPSVYESSSIVKIDPESSGSMKVAQGIGGEEGVGEAPSLSGEIGVLENSFELARRVAGRLKKQANTQTTNAGFPIWQGGEAAVDTAQAAQRILQKVEFTESKREDLIKIVVESRDPEEASAIANAYAEVYKEHSREKARAQLQAARTFLENQVEEQREKIDRLERRWKAFARDNRLAEHGEGGERLTTKFNELKARRNELKFKIDKERTQLKLLRRKLEKFQPRLEENIIEKQEASSLRSEIEALEEKIAQARAEAATYYAENPNLEGDTARIRSDFPELARLLNRSEALEDRKRALTSQLVEKVSGPETTVNVDVEGNPIERASTLRKRITQKRLNMTQLKSQVAALDSQIARYDKKLDQIPNQRVRRDQIERKLQQAESFHATIMEELRRVSVAEESEFGYVKVVQSAVTPSVPVRPKVTLNLILGLLLGLGFGVGFAFMREATNTRLRRPSDVERKGYNLLGVVPDMTPEIERVYDGREFIEVEGEDVGEQELSTRLAPLLNPWSPVTENYRMIRVNLARSEQSGIRRMLVTSAEMGEGKTITAVNLAITEALSGSRTLLIDADMRKPTAHNVLGMSQTPGLADVLEELPDVSCWETAIDGLYFIPAGMAEAAPSRILDSEHIPQLLEATGHYFDAVIMDTPPTQAVTDSVVIGAQTNAEAVVVSAAEGDSRVLDAAMQALRSADVDVAGVVLNKFKEEALQDGTYEYSYYGEDKYKGDYQAKALEAVEDV